MPVPSSLGRMDPEATGALWETLRHHAREHVDGLGEAGLLSAGVAFCGALDLSAPLALVGALASAEELEELQQPQLDRTAQLARILELLIQLSLRDALTGLYNRRHFDHRLLQELRRCERDEQPCSVMLIDLDDFKQINDREGHEAGDEALRCLAGVLGGVLRVSDEVARLGGDEFAVILPSTALRPALQSVAPRLLAAVETQCGLSVSVGLATFEAQRPVSPEELLRRADAALYQAKAAGKGAVRAFEQPAEQGAVNAQEREALLR